MLESLQAQSRELGIAGGLRASSLPARMSAPWLRCLDMFVIASYSESFPNTLLEAMACGCAPIGSNVGGIPELIEDGVNGLVFESKSVDALSAAMERTITSDSLRGTFCAAAAETARDRFFDADSRREDADYCTGSFWIVRGRGSNYSMFTE